MTPRTFSRSDWEAAQAAWLDGEFSDEWREIRHQAAMRGMIFPPEGSKWDSWEDDEPSQRAMLVRAVRETPSLLTKAISRSRTWFEVIAFVNGRRDEWRDGVTERDREDQRRRHEMEPTGREAAQSIKAILTRIGDS